MNQLNLNPIRTVERLDYEAIIKQGDQIIDDILNWKKGPTYEVKVNEELPKVITRTFGEQVLNGSRWYGRVTDLSNTTSEVKKKLIASFHNYLIGSTDDISKSHSVYEKNYIDTLYQVEYELIDASSKGSMTYKAILLYKFPFPIKKRVFYELIHVIKKRNESYVISMALDPSNFSSSGDLSKTHVVGKYTSIENLSYNEESDSLFWKMCTCSDPGGLIPNWLTSLTLHKEISKDVPGFLKWSSSQVITE